VDWQGPVARDVCADIDCIDGDGVVTRGHARGRAGQGGIFVARSRHQTADNADFVNHEPGQRRRLNILTNPAMSRA
jgi:hypothetical protein